MKNKKLFAILTLVCFMFTLMPVAAFAGADTYAEVQKDSEAVTLVDGKATVVIDLYNLTAGDYVLYAYKDGSFYKTLGFVEGNDFAAADKDKWTVTVEDAGEYEFVVVDTAMPADKANMTNAEIINWLQDKNTMSMSSKDTAYVSSGAAKYGIEVISGVDSLKADSGFDPATVRVRLVTLNEDGSVDKGVAGKDLTVRTNSSAVKVSDATVTTNPGGYAEFEVSASVAGEFKIYVEYGSKAKAVIDVTSKALDPAVITTVAEPQAPVALDSYVSASGIRFQVTDANDNAIEKNLKNTVVKAIVTAPKGSAIKDNTIVGLTYDKEKGNFKLNTTATFDKEGTYTFRLALKNGAYATASVEVKEFQTPVALKVAYPTTTVEVDGVLAPEAIYYVDANNVVKYLDATDFENEVKLSANGYAVDTFEAKTAAAGTVTVKASESYVGSKITVIAVSEEYGLVDTVELTVANEGTAVKYADTKADVAVNNTLVANIVDANGGKVALNAGKVKDATVQYIVLSQPENAKVAISTKSTADLKAKGEFKVSFTASEIGTYKVQTVVRYEQLGNDNEPVVKYYSGIEEITVGNTGFEDIVVMSVGSNEIVVNAETVAIDAAPVVENNRTFVPFRALIQAFGAEVAYDEATQAVTAELNGTTVVMTIGSAEYTVNGVAKTADVAPFIAGSRTMVPVRFVAEEFGIKVTPTYDENGATADILFAK